MRELGIPTPLTTIRAGPKLKKDELQLLWNEEQDAAKIALRTHYSMRQINRLLVRYDIIRKQE